MAGKKGMKGEGLGGVRYGQGRPFGLGSFVVSFPSSTNFNLLPGESPFPAIYQTQAWSLLGRVIRIRKATVIAFRGAQSDDPMVEEVRSLVGQPDALVLRVGGPVSGVAVALTFDASRMAVMDLFSHKQPKPVKVPKRQKQAEPQPTEAEVALEEDAAEVGVPA